MRIWNADGGEVATCGNAARCVGWLLMQASGRKSVRMKTTAGMLEAFASGGEMVTVDMGAPLLEWTDIPLSGPADTQELDLRVEAARGGPGAVSMGNPHLVFFVDNVEAAPVESLGHWLERHQRFPEGVNVGFAQIKATDRIRLRVWERGVGTTRACGTGACAAVVAASRRGLTGRHAAVEMDGGELIVDWSDKNGHVYMRGPVAVEFTGRIPTPEPAPPHRVERSGSPPAANDMDGPVQPLWGSPASDPFRRA
jgi:diaminopimelate epimerase